MATAICLRCGEAKDNPLAECPACEVTPDNDPERALSLALSELLATPAQLGQYAREIGSSRRPSVPLERLQAAKRALADPNLPNILRKHFATKEPECSPQDASPQKVSQPASSCEEFGITRLAEAPLLRNPFAALGVSIRDDRAKILEAAEQRSLERDPEECRKAKGTLTNPRSRLSAEVAWLPGLSPQRAGQLLGRLRAAPRSIPDEAGLPVLAHCNLTEAAIYSLGPKSSAEDAILFIKSLTALSESLDPEKVLQEINEDRSVAGFPDVGSADLVEAELWDRKRVFVLSIKTSLNQLRSEVLLLAVTDVVSEATAEGTVHAPELIDELVDGYALEVQGTLESGIGNLQTLINSAEELATGGESAVAPYIDRIEHSASAWERIARPIQLSAKARGIDHDLSIKLAGMIRGLSLYLFNKHDMLETARRVTGLLEKLFAKLPQISELAEQDSRTLIDIKITRENAQAERQKNHADWAKAITFAADVGFVFKDRLSVDPSGVQWKGVKWPLESITAVRWGGARQQFSLTGSVYKIGLAANKDATEIEVFEEGTYSGFTAALWRAVCVRLMLEACEVLGKGHRLKFGEIEVDDTTVTVIRRTVIESGDRVRLELCKAQIWTQNGRFYVGVGGDKKLYASASYIRDWNTHLLEHMIRSLFKKNATKLSEVFE